MPDLRCFMNDGDLLNAMGFALSLGCEIVPDLLYEQSKFSTIQSADEFMQLRAKTKATLYFLVHKDWLESPFEMGVASRKEGRRYFIHQKTGGPTIDVFAPNFYAPDERRYIPMGYIGYHSRYWSTKQKELLAPNSFLKNTYTEISSYVRRSGQPISIGKKKCIMMPGAHSDQVNGWVLGSP